MKEIFERHQEKLTSRERLAMWERVRGETSSAGGAVRDGARLDLRPRRLSWGAVIAAGAIAAALVTGLLLKDRASRNRDRTLAAVAGEAAPDAAPEDKRFRSLDYLGSPPIANDEKSDEESELEADRATDREAPRDSRADDPILVLKKKPAEPGRREGQVVVTSPEIAARSTAGEETPIASATSPAHERLDVAVESVAEDTTATLRGIVKNAKDGTPLAYASVQVVDTNRGTNTREDGSFEIAGLPSGSYTIKVTLLGFTEKTLAFVVGGNDTRTFNVALLETDATATEVINVLGTQERIDIESSSSETKVEVKYEFKHRGTKSVGGQDGEIYARGGRANKPQAEADKNSSWGKVHGLSGSSPPPTASPPPVYPTTGGSTLPNDEVYDSMFFDHYGVNPFIPTEDDALSTFAVDVDAASYTVARRYIDEGHLPPDEAIRVEEFVNFFRQDYADFTEPDFRILLEGAPSPFGTGYHLVRVGIKGRQIDARDRKPASLVFVIDVSGSMAREDRLELVKRALRLLVDRLRADDSVGIVVYGSNGRVLLGPTSVENRERIIGAIDGLAPDGSTNAEEGILLGYEMARREFRRGAINRIILCSDGVANVGRTGPESILDRVSSEADRGIELSTIGFGMGNYNDVLMEQLADKGDGYYYYVDDIKEARGVFEENLTGTLQTIARDAKLQVEFNPRVVTRYRLLGFENRDVADKDFRNDAIDAGEIGAGHEVTALYEVKLAEEAPRAGRVATVRFRYAMPDRGIHDTREMEASLEVGRLARSFDAAPARFRLDAVVAEFAEILRKSYWARGSTIRSLVPEARRLAGELRGDDAVAEFSRLVARAAELSDKLSPAERGRQDIEDGEPGEGPEPRE